MTPFEQTRPWRGVGLAAIVALSYAANSTFAGVAYDGGSNAASMFGLRSTAAFLVLWIYLRASGRAWRLEPDARNLALGLGLILAGASYALLAAVEFMPVALCVISLYTYPLLVALFSWISGREQFKPRYGGALLLAFFGLVMALGLDGGDVSAPGVALALLAAVAVATLLIVNERANAARGSPAFTFHMLAICSAASLLTVVASGGIALPRTTFGWVGFVATPICYSFAVIFMFVAVSRIGSLRTSLVMNLEPVAAVLFGYVLLSQALTWVQLAGIGCVVIAILSIEGFNAVRTGQISEKSP